VDSNLKRLNSYSIEVENQRVPVPDRGGRWNVPMKISAISVILRDSGNRELGRTKIPVLPYSKALASEKPTLEGLRSLAARFQLPAMAQAGRPLEIQGPFDGDFENTIVRLDGQIVRILGESPRKVVVQNPRNHIGKTEIEVLKGDVVWRCRYRNIGLSISAPKLALDHGEETTLTVTAEGLQGLERAVPVALENRSPIVVGLNGGNKQTISLLPEEVVDGTISATRTLTGIGPGDFNIVVGVADTAVPSDCESWNLQQSGS
jgi:hypothetical protein